MDIPLQNNATTNDSLLKSRLEGLSRLEGIGIKKNLSDTDKAGFAKAARGFEAIFVNMMFKQMKSAMLKEPQEDMTFGANTLSGYTDMLFADQVSNTGAGIGLAQMIYKQLTGDNLKPVQTINPAESTTGAAAPATNSTKAPAVIDTPPPAGNFIEKMKQRLGNIDDIIAEASKKFNIPNNLIKAVITAESAGNANAQSPAGAKGLMQLMDGTAQELGVNDSFDPYQNVMGGAAYIRKMLDNFDGDMELALAAYNAGPGNVMKYGGVPPFKETQQYVQKVKRYNDIYSA